MPDSAEVTEPVWNGRHVTSLSMQQLYAAIAECERIVWRHLNRNHGRRSGRRNRRAGAKRRRKHKWQVARAQSWLVILRGEQVRRRLVSQRRPIEFPDNYPKLIWRQEWQT